MTKWTHEPLALEDEGRYLAASDRYVEEATSVLLEHDLRPWGGGAAPLGLLFGAASTAVRGEDEERARYLREWLEVSAAFSRNAVAEDDPELAAFCDEWIGDSYLLVEPSEALEWYESARARFEVGDQMQAHHWADRLGNDYQSTALRRFLVASGIDSPDDILFSGPYDARLAAKREVAESLSESK